MITLEQYFGPHFNSPDRTEARTIAANDLLRTVSMLMEEMMAAGVDFPINPATGCEVSGQTYGGFRPQNCPQGAPNSSHKEGMAVDLYDPHGDIDAWLLKNEDVLVRHGVYIEHPDKTKNWSHWSIKPPKSGRHIFWP
jgi:hypothetical protein